MLSKKMRRLAPALRSAGIEYSEGEEGHSRKKIKTLMRPIREHNREPEEDWEPGNDVAKDGADDDTREGEERPDGSPFDFDFDLDGGKVGNPFAPDDDGANAPADRGEEPERQPAVTGTAGSRGHSQRRRYAGAGMVPAPAT